MKEVKLIIQINKPVQEVFNFLLNPANTPLWIDGLVKEETNEWPVKIGTKYRNVGEDGVWGEYTLIEHEPYQSFELLKDDNNYHVHYTFTELANDKTELEYFEWVEHGELPSPFTEEIMQKLKSVMEQE